jgi:sugar lactone lactonase YvrE
VEGSPGDASGYGDVAVDPNGNVWAADGIGGEIEIDEYSPSGILLKAFKPFARPDKIAFDANGDLYLSTNDTTRGFFGIYRLDAPDYQKRTLIVASFSVTNLAVDRVSHDLYAVIENHVVRRYDADGTLLEEFGSGLPSNISGLAVNQASGDVYVTTDSNGGKQGSSMILGFKGLDLPLPTTGGASSPTETVVTLNGTVRPDGNALTECHFEYVTETAFEASGFADLSSGGSLPCTPAAGSIPADSTKHPVSAVTGALSAGVPYRFRLVASNANGANAGQPGEFRLGQPVVETTGSPLRTATTARLEGRVYPHGLPTTYRFEYGDSGPCDANPCSSSPASAAGSGDDVELVSEPVEGLQPGTTYHYRLVADNGNPAGSEFGADMTVATRTSDAPLSHGHFPGPAGSDRAWELVTAPDTGGNPAGALSAASDDGNRAVYGVSGGTPESTVGSLTNQLFSERTASGWKSRAVYPPRSEAHENFWLNPAGRSDLSSFVSQNFDSAGTGIFSIWRMSPSGAASEIFSIEKSAWAEFSAVSDDATRSLAALRGSLDATHPTAPGATNLYDVSSGTPQLVSLLPDGNVPACGVAAGGIGGLPLPGEQRRGRRWVSSDGSYAFFPSKGSSCAGPLNLYVRNLSSETTTLVSDGDGSESRFIKSTPGAAFFWTKGSLAAGDTGGGDVYRYDLDDDSLKCVTCVVPGLDANVDITENPSDSLAISEDGSRVYFTSTGRLVPGAPVRGLYRVDVESGELAYVAHPGDYVGEAGSSAINADGSVLIFSSSDASLNPLGGFTNGGTSQYYRYDDRDRSLVCVSCPQDGSAPRGGVDGNLGIGGLGPNTGPLDEQGTDFAFSTPTALVSADQNTAKAGQEPGRGTDVYEWRDGRPFLVSDGLTSWPATYGPTVGGITPSGRDLFFGVAAQLTADALDGYKRVYDARIGGGISAPPPPKPCPLDVCQGTPKGAPEEAPPSSSSLGIPGDSAKRPAKCRKGYSRRRGRCVSRKHRHAHHRATNRNRKAGR